MGLQALSGTFFAIIPKIAVGSGAQGVGEAPGCAAACSAQLHRNATTMLWAECAIIQLMLPAAGWPAVWCRSILSSGALPGWKVEAKTVATWIAIATRTCRPISGASARHAILPDEMPCTGLPSRIGPPEESTAGMRVAGTRIRKCLSMIRHHRVILLRIRGAAMILC